MTHDAHHWANDDEYGLEPSYGSLVTVRHYYGDVVRQFFLYGSALMLLASPLYASSLRDELPFVVVGAVVAVTFAGLTNPKTRWVLVSDAIIAGVAAVLFAVWGLLSYGGISMLAFGLRMFVAVVFLFAFYYAVKSVRASILHQIGRRERADEFEKETRAPDALPRESFADEEV